MCNSIGSKTGTEILKISVFISIKKWENMSLIYYSLTGQSRIGLI